VIGGGPDGGSASGSPAGGFAGLLTSLAAPIGYLALVLLVAFIIARRRVARQDQAAFAEVAARAAIELHTAAAQRSEPETRPEVAVDEENVPRWLRPSVRAQRFGLDLTPRRPLPSRFVAPPPSRTPLAFGGVPSDLDDRRLVQGSGISLLDQPGEGAGRSLLQLELGDEVAIIGRDGPWVNVLTPTGEAGWLPDTFASPGVRAEGAAWAPARRALPLGTAGCRCAARPRRAPRGRTIPRRQRPATSTCDPGSD
jgi:hypothetical protein